MTDDLPFHNDADDLRLAGRSEKHSFPLVLFLAMFFLFLGAAAALSDDDYPSGLRSIERQTDAAIAIWNAPTPSYPRERSYGLDRPTDWQRVIPDYDLRLYEPDNRRWEERKWDR